MTVLEIYVLVAPVLVLLMALAAMRLTRYLAEREERRRHAAE
jgi:hypothetical protein